MQFVDGARKARRQTNLGTFCYHQTIAVVRLVLLVCLLMLVYLDVCHVRPPVLVEGVDSDSDVRSSQTQTHSQSSQTTVTRRIWIRIQGQRSQAWWKKYVACTATHQKSEFRHTPSLLLDGLQFSLCASTNHASRPSGEDRGVVAPAPPSPPPFGTGYTDTLSSHRRVSSTVDKNKNGRREQKSKSSSEGKQCHVVSDSKTGTAVSTFAKDRLLVVSSISTPLFEVDLNTGEWHCLDRLQQEPVVARTEFLHLSNGKPGPGLEMLTQLRNALAEHLWHHTKLQGATDTERTTTGSNCLLLTNVLLVRSGVEAEATPLRPLPTLANVCTFLLAFVVGLSGISSFVLWMLPLFLQTWAMACSLLATMVYFVWLFDSISVLPAAAAEITLHPPSTFTMKNHAIEIHMSDTLPGNLQFMHGPMSRRQALQYSWRVGVNMQLNNFARATRLLLGLIQELISRRLFLMTRPEMSRTALYVIALNCSVHRWIRDDGHIHLTHVRLFAWDRELANKRMTWLQRCIFRRTRSTHTLHYDSIVIELDHERQEMASMRLKPSAMSTAGPEFLITDPEEMIAILSLIIAIYSHPSVHLSGVRCHEVASQWPLASEAHIAANGLGYAASNIVGALLTPTRDAVVNLLIHNATQPVPHFAGATAHRLMVRCSAAYRMMVRAHRDPVLLSTAEGDPWRVSSILQGSLYHGLDHYILDIFLPYRIYSHTLGMDLTPFIHFGAGHNASITNAFDQPCDKVSHRLHEILIQEAPQWEGAYQWAICE